MPHATPQLLNWCAGWFLVLAAFVTGAAIGLRFHRDDFWGGYASFRRRIVRLGHVALAALGLMNVVYSVAPGAGAASALGRAASICFVVGGITMPLACFLTGWRARFRHLFAVPVLALVAAVVLVLCGAAL
jgi:hypothetical protein